MWRALVEEMIVDYCSGRPGRPRLIIQTVALLVWVARGEGDVSAGVAPRGRARRGDS